MHMIHAAAWRLSAAFALAIGMALASVVAVAAEVEVVRVNLFPTAKQLPFLLGNERGIFARRGIKLDLQYTENSTTQRADLASGKVSHYEALARFSNPEGTQDTVKFIEALGIADAFDLAVAAKVVSQVEKDATGRHHIAFNVSGRTIASPLSFGMLVSMLAQRLCYDERFYHRCLLQN